MRLRYLFPHQKELEKITFLSKEARKRLEWMDFYLGHGKNARLACRHFGISPDTFYRWKRRFNPKDLKSLEDDLKTRRPHHLREMTTPVEYLRRVIAIRKEDPEKSKYEIQEQLRREGILMGTTVIQKIIQRHPYLFNPQHQKKIRSRRKKSIARIKAAKELKERCPGSLVQIDTKHLYILNRRFYLFAAVDCKSRVGYTSAFKRGSSSSGEAFLNELINFFPFPIEALQTDNGSEYLLNFHKRCREAGVTHYFTDPQSPKQNGRVERFIQTAVYEFFNYQDDLLDDLEMLREKCQIFNFKYNYQRFHQMLGYKTPAEALENHKIHVKLEKVKVYGN